MKQVIIAAVLALVATGAWAGGERSYGGKGGNATGGTGIGVGVGQAQSGANSTAGNQLELSSSEETKAYGYGIGFGLTTSQGDCPLLGSFNAFVIGGTYEVELCRAIIEANVMGQMGFSKTSQVNRICQIESIAENAQECHGRAIRR